MRKPRFTKRSFSRERDDYLNINRFQKANRNSPVYKRAAGLRYAIVHGWSSLLTNGPRTKIIYSPLTRETRVNAFFELRVSMSYVVICAASGVNSNERERDYVSF